MTRLCYDSTNPADIPADAPVVAGYVDGRYAWTAAGWGRFPKSVLVRISAVGTDAGTVGDVEPGCIWPPGAAVPWVLKRRQAGIDPTIYCNQWNSWSQVRQAFQAARVAEPHYWVANYDNVPTIPPGAVAKQYANPTLTGRHFDLSICVDDWPGVDGLHGGTGGTMAAPFLNPDDPAVKELAAVFKAIGDGGEQTAVVALEAAIKAAGGGGAAPDLTQLTADVADIKATLARMEAGFKAA